MSDSQAVTETYLTLVGKPGSKPLLERQIIDYPGEGMYVGVPADDGGWASRPVYSPTLAYEIAKRTRTISGLGLRELLYDDTPCDDIPPDAVQAITLGYQRYQAWAALQPKRGL